MRRRIAHAWTRLFAKDRALLPIVFAETAPLDLRIVGRVVLHAVLVGLTAGLAGAAFFAALEYVQHFLLEDLAGYVPLRAHGEASVVPETEQGEFRPWLLLLLPGIGALLGGVVTRYAPEARGGGGDATIEAFHHHGGMVRPRVGWVKALASILTLGSGGSGGREGPTMQIGGALGSAVAQLLHVSARERRILMLAGVAAGISAVFRTPLGAALLAVEFLYRDGFEADALVPSVLASVISYSVVISIFGETTMFAHPPRFPFVPAHLPLYGLLAIGVAALATLFVWALQGVRRTSARLPVPAWARPGVGGLLLGVMCVPLIWVVSPKIGVLGQGLGILGGGYGVAQVAMSGAAWLPEGWKAVQLLLLLCGVKLVASSLTIGSGGSAGDFAPSLVLGGLFGGAFGRMAQLLLEDPSIDPAAFALVGMGAFYGGIAHVPLSALVLVCEMAGSYDLLVPLMLAEGIAFVALRRRSLYSAQVPTQRDSPVHRDALLIDVLKAMRVHELMVGSRPFVSFQPQTSTAQMLRAAADHGSQDVFPVIDGSGRIKGLVRGSVLRLLATEGDAAPFTIAADLMQPPVVLHVEDDLRKATETIVANGMREIPVVNDSDEVIGFIDEAEVARIYLKAAARADADARVEPAVSDPGG